MAIQTKLDGSGLEYTEIWTGTPSAPVLGATITSLGISGTITPDDPLASTTSVQAPLVIAGNADAATARTGGTARAPDVTGATTNVAGADLSVAAGLGHGSGTAGTIILKAADVAASGNNPQSLATVGTVAFAGLTMAAGKTISSPTISATTSATSPKIIGGTAVGSDLTLQSTSGVGDATDYVYIKVGNNGGTTAATFDATGIQGILGATTAAAASVTTIAASTSATTPKLLGGSGTQSDLTLQSTSGVGDGTDYVLVKVGNNGGTTAATFDATGMQGALGVTTPAAASVTTLTESGALVATPDVLEPTSEGVAALLTTFLTAITTNGDSDEDAITLADGSAVGQLKAFIVNIAGNAADSVKITPSNLLGGTKITFGADPTGKGCLFAWTAAGWTVVATNGGTIA